VSCNPEGGAALLCVFDEGPILLGAFEEGAAEGLGGLLLGLSSDGFLRLPEGSCMAHDQVLQQAGHSQEK